MLRYKVTASRSLLIPWFLAEVPIALRGAQFDAGQLVPEARMLHFTDICA